MLKTFLRPFGPCQPSHSIRCVGVAARAPSLPAARPDRSQQDQERPVPETLDNLLASIAPTDPSPSRHVPPASAVRSDDVPPPLDDPATSTSGSDFLFRQAEIEDARAASEPSSRKPTRVLTMPEDAPWTGDEPIETAVLRMLVDKHKPQRTGKMRSSEDKIRAERVKLREVEDFQREVLERIESDNGQGHGSSSTKRNSKVFDGHLVGGDPNHRPWHSTYAAPTSSISPLVKRGHLLTPSSSNTLVHSAALLALPNSPAARASVRRARKLKQGVVRLGQAKEGALDYELGVGQFAAGTGPSSAGIGKEGENDGHGGKLEVRAAAGDDALGAGWGSLVELRIERSMAEGAFKNLPGRGKPLEDHPDMANPHISRSDYLLNKMVQRNDALPAWIEYFREHTAALEHLRARLVETLHRRLLIHPGLALGLGEDEIARLRVRELEVGGKERAFWEGLVQEANKLARRGDGVAPPITRRGTTSLDLELEGAYAAAAPLVHQSLHRPPAPSLTEEQLRAIGSDVVRWDLVLPGWWLRWWASVRRIVYGPSTMATEEPSGARGSSSGRDR